MGVTINQTVKRYEVVVNQVARTIQVTISPLGKRGFGVASGGVTGQVLAKKTDADYDTEWVEQTGGVGGSTPDATTSVKGKIKLAGDLAGSADSPTVPALANKVDKVTGSRLITSAESTLLENTSNTNTGDETASSIITKIGDGTKINQSYLPSYVDDILEFTNLASFPITGEIGKIYIAISPSNIQYRWSGSAYIAITNGLIASTNEVPEGVSNLYFTTARVLSTVLTGISFLTGGAIVSTDSVLTAFGKLQKQITDLLTTGSRLIESGEITKLGKYPSTATNGKILQGDGTNYIEVDAPASSFKTGFFQVAHGEVSFTTPTDITTTTVFEFELIGAGGGGGTAPAASGGAASGGGGGEYVLKRITGLEPNTAYSCVIGTGSATRAPGVNIPAGGNTTLTIGANTYVANGGGGGVSAINSPGGVGGLGGNGDLNIPGESGGDSGPNSTISNCGKGGSSGRGWGAGGREVANNVVGENGKNFGGGASSGHGNAQLGGTGANGRIICRWFNQ